MRISDDSIRGRLIVSSDGQQVGEVDALHFESDEWRVESLHVKLRKDVADNLGATRGVFHAGGVEIPIRMVQSVGESVVLSVPIDDLRKVLPGDSQHSAATQK
jgi:sporulation protein YlmC with PRC-barrel domain